MHLPQTMSELHPSPEMQSVLAAQLGSEDIKFAGLQKGNALNMIHLIIIEFFRCILNHS